MIILILSVGGVSATEDSSNDAIDVDYEPLSKDLSISVESCDIDSYQNDYVKIVESSDSDVVDLNSVTNSTFFQYFDKDGNLSSNVTGNNLTFTGEFGGLGVDTIYINRPIDLIGENAVFNNITFVITSSNVTINGFSFDFSSDENLDCFAIYANQVSNLTIANCNFKFRAVSNGDNKIGVVCLEDVNGVLFENNKMDASLSSVPVKYDPIDWSSIVLSQGVVISGSNIIADNNELNLVYNTFNGYYDSLYGFSISADNVTFSRNNVSVKGHSYVYAAIFSGSNVTIDNNVLKADSDKDYANALSINGPFSGEVKNNQIEVSAKDVAYGIYSSGWNGIINATYVNNSITAKADVVYGMELTGVEEVVKDNTISTIGNWTMGIVSSTNFLVIEGNDISAIGEGKSNVTSADSFGVTNTGILVKSTGDAIIRNNNITSTGIYTVEVKAAGSTVEDNYLIAKSFTGDASVLSDGIVANNTPALSRSEIIVEDLIKYYRNGSSLVINLCDQWGNPLANQTIAITINGVTYYRTTDVNGTVSMAINLDAGIYNCSISYNGTDNYTSAEAKATVTVLPIITGEDVVKYFRNGTQYHVKVVDGQGNPVANQKVTINIHGVFYERETNEEGIATLNINLAPGTYIATAYYNNAAVSNTIEVLPILKADDLVKTQSETASFKATALDEHGNPIANAEVTFNINGVFYHKTTDANGVASLNIRLIEGTYIITSIYNDCTIANTVTVTK